MATTAQINELRDNIKEPNNTEPYTDEFLGELIDEYGVDNASYRIWRSKAAGVAKLVDISEGGSSRKMSQVHDNYLAIASSYLPGGGDGSVVRAPTSRDIER